VLHKTSWQKPQFHSITQSQQDICLIHNRTAS
jgi:hypothetical protein